MFRTTRRTFCQSLLATGVVSVAGCTNSEQGERGDVRIENEDTTEHTVHVRISELVQSAETASNTPTADAVSEFRINDRYTVAPDSVTKVGSIAQSEGSGRVKATGELKTGETIERWIDIPTQYVWTIHIASDAALTWKWVGIE
jgi:hypothetical protein